MNMATV